MARAHPKPLEGLTVVAVEQAVAAPFCSMRLADAGATVIKIERPEGDFARGYDQAAKGLSSYFVWLNRGKESVVLDLKTASAKAALEELIAGADILVQNLKQGAFEALGFSTERLQRTYPRLINCCISGYGPDGPLADRKAYDLLIQGESGLSSITGGPQEPGRVGISIVDIATGATAYSAVLEALLARQATGLGADIHVSMFDVMAEWLTVPLLHGENGNPPKRIGLSHPSIAPYGVFRSKDQHDILVAIQSDREWRNLSTHVLGQAELGADPRFATNVARVQNRPLTDALLAKAFAALDRDALVEALIAADIAIAQVNDMAALSRHPHLRLIEVETAAGPVAIPAPAARLSDAVAGHGAVPRLGEHHSTPAKMAAARARGDALC